MKMIDATPIDSLVALNDTLCENIRKSGINVPVAYTGTILPSFLDCNSGEFETIQANSNGPINPKSFFTLPQEERILVILMEPYIPLTSFGEGDRGGHNQAKDYFDAITESGWNGIENSTYQNIAKITYSVLTGKRFENCPEIKFEAATMLRDHVAIININNFPCLCTATTSISAINDWAKLNRTLISQQIQLYDTRYIYCGGTAYDCFQAYSNTEGYFGPYHTKVLPGAEIESIAGWPLFGQRDFFYDDRHLIINGYHPRCFRYKNIDGLLKLIQERS